MRACALLSALLATSSQLVAANYSEDVEVDALRLGDECAAPGEDCGLGLLQLRGQKLRTEVAESPEAPSLVESAASSWADVDAYESTVDEILEDSFKRVTDFGSFIESDVRLEDTWRVCTDVDWSGAAGRIAMDYDGTMKLLGLDNKCDSKSGDFREEATCKAIQAAAVAIARLESKFSEGPKFVNYLLVDWGSKPSWRNGTVVVDNSKMPPDAKVLDRNGANAYGFCDLIRTVLTQSANQMQSGTCGYVASLAALSHLAPAKAIKLGVRLMWTGRPTRLVEPPCDYIYEQKPGLVPFVDSSGQVRPAAFQNLSALSCTGSAADCQGGSGKPLQNAGLSFMWSQSLIASYSRSLTKTCPQDGPAKLNFPGLSSAARRALSEVQGQTGGSSLWACDAVIDPQDGSCDVAFNKGICGPLKDDECQLLMTYQVDGSEKARVDEAVMSGIDAASEFIGDVDQVRQSFAEHKPRFLKTIRESLRKEKVSVSGNQYGSFLIKLLDRAGVDAVFVASNVFTPSGDEALLARACKEPVALLAIDSEPLQGFAGSDPFQPLKGPHFPTDYKEVGTCNHMVYLEKCDAIHNVYTLWTWGTRRYVTRELLLGKPHSTGSAAVAPRTSHTFNTGILCFVTFAQKVTWAPAHLDPSKLGRRPFGQGR